MINIDGSFRDWLLDFIPREDQPNDCEILDIDISYREVRYTYRTPKGEEKEDSLTIDLW